MYRAHGATPLSNDRTLFRLWAPDAREVAVEFETGSLDALPAEDEGWFSATLPGGAGTRYRFVIDDDLRVPDPASHYQPQGIHGFSQVVDHAAWPWHHPQWQGRPWHEAIIYELHAGLLNGFSGTAGYLPYLAELGITAVELMPLSEFPGVRNWGYDGVLPFAPQSSYGSPDDLKRLVDTAHGLGLMVYVDVVYNHFGPEGNYLPRYASPFFRDDLTTPWGSSIDFRRREVRDYFCENALMWVMDYHVDGLRFDAVHAIPDRDFLCQLARRVRSAAGPDRHVHLVLENEHNCATLIGDDFDAQWNDDGHNVLHTMLTGESEGYYRDFAAGATERLARCLHEGFVYQGEPTAAGHSRGEPSGHLPPTSFVLFLQNHDQVGNRAHGERLVMLADENALKAAIALMLLCPMVPLLFMGEEWGTRQPFLYFTDHPEPLAEAVRNGRLREFQAFSTFAGDAGTRIPDPNEIATFELSKPYYVAPEQTQNAPWHSYYSELLGLRHQYLLPRLPGSRSRGVTVLGDAALAAEWQLGDGSILHIALNLGAKFQPAPRNPPGAVIFSHGADVALQQLNPCSVVVRLQEAQ